MPRTPRKGTARASSDARPVATIRDVARRAGVSVATVSRALNKIGPMSQETMKRVADAAKAMRYVPHAAARSLSIRRSLTICVLLPEVHGEFFSELVSALDLAARERGYHLLVSSSHDDTAEMGAVLQALRGRVDGIILMWPQKTPGGIGRVLSDDLPAVLINSSARGRRSIQIDNYAGARAMTEHLIASGHRAIAFIGGPEKNVDALERLRGFREAISAAGLSRQSVELNGRFTEESGYDAVSRMRASGARPTAIFAANDAMAIGAMFALREAGVLVPEQVALAGFDDIPIARYLSPQLTTVSVDIGELGRRAVAHLLSEIETPGGATRRKELIKTTLAIRESCGSPREARNEGFRNVAEKRRSS